MKQYQWGILSTANIGRKAMVPALKASAMADVVAVASRDTRKAQSFADEFAIPKAYGDYQSLLDDPVVEAVYIPLPNHLHKDWTIRSAEAGKHILCEKPLALNPQECREMIAAAEANDVLLMESFMYRHHPRIEAARQMVRSGVIGSVKTIESAQTFRLDDKQNIRYNPEMGGGALMDVGCYCVNISRLMAGREPVSVQARAVWTSTGVDEQLTGLLDFGNGLMAHFDCALNMVRRERCIVAGTDGYLSMTECFLPGTGKTLIAEEKGQGGTRTHSFKGVDEYRLIAEDFMRSITDDSPTFPPEDAVSNMRVIQALLMSAKHNGTSVQI